MFTMRGLFALSMSLLLALPASAQSVTSASSASSEATASSTSSSSSAIPTVHRVNVGRAGFAYEPNVTYANEGDIVQFVFYQSNHSVIRAEYAGSNACGQGKVCNPCVPYEIIHGTGGFHSGNQIVTGNNPLADSISGSDKVWNLTITNTSAPIFYYCNAIGSCHPNGMVGVINPNELTPLSKQFDAAVQADFQLAPGEAWPLEGTVGAETGNSTSSASTSHHSSLSGGAIAGIVIGGLAVLALAAALFYFMGRSKTYKDMFKASRHGGSEGGAGMSETGDRVGPWTPGPHGQAATPYYDNPSVSTPSQGYQDHRASHMTYNSMAPSDVGTFVGYNRNTGEPEFAAEAPADAPGAQYSTHSSPAQKQGGFHPPPPFQPSAPIPEQQVYEAPGDTPRRSEKPA